MPRARVSDDIDHVPVDLKSTKPSKKPLPEPWPLPLFTPLRVKIPFSNGVSNLPQNVSPQSPYDVFSLFFDEETLQVLVNHTNEFAELYPGNGSIKPSARAWFPTTTKELRAYIGAYIWMGLHPESTIEAFWNTLETSTIHPALTKATALKRWQQIDRYFCYERTLSAAHLFPRRPSASALAPWHPHRPFVC